MVITKIAHRGWGRVVNTVYDIVTDATPRMPVTMVMVAHVPKGSSSEGAK